LALRLRHIARNVLLNWIGSVANMAVGLFLSPFILHRLGNVAFSVWVLAVSVVSYMVLLDLGMQSSVLRFVSKGHTQKDHQGASEAISAALWVRLQISALVLLLSVGLAAIFPHAFKVPIELASDARKAILLIGLTTAMSMSLGVVGGVISALNRYDLQNYVGMVQTAVRVIGVVIVLRRGHGIVAIAICELIAAMVGNLLMIAVARKLYPELRIRLRKPQKAALTKIWTYGSYVFLNTIAVQLIYQTDNLVVGSAVSVGAVAFYAIANNLCRYASQAVGAMGSTFIPAASTYEASGDTHSLLMLYKNGTRATLAISLPILIAFIVRGHSFIGLWMGREYAVTSGNVLTILSFSLVFAFANRTAGSIAFGIEKHKVGAIWGVGEGVANLVLSIILAHWYGIYGVAVGTLIPSLVVHIALWPGYISKLVGLSRLDVLWKIWMPMFAAAIPYVIITYAIERFLPARNLAVFSFQILVSLPVFYITIGIVFWPSVRDLVMPKLRSMFVAEARP
jgi:O-antigen/teichoic acid export membrane protein